MKSYHRGRESLRPRMSSHDVARIGDGFAGLRRGDCWVNNPVIGDPARGVQARLFPLVKSSVVSLISTTSSAVVGWCVA